jgi:hypothetical protein
VNNLVNRQDIYDKESNTKRRVILKAYHLSFFFLKWLKKMNWKTIKITWDSTNRTQPNTRANPERTRGSLPEFALRSLLKILHSLWIRSAFALGSLSGCALRTHAWSGPRFYLAASKPRPLYIPNIYTVAILVIVDFVLR